MGKNCSTCEYATFGAMDPMSDICDSCQNDPDTGWGGFTDHSIGKHFNSEEERDEYLRNHSDDYEDDEMDSEFF